MNTPGRSNKLHAKLHAAAASTTGLPALLSISQVAEATGMCDRTIRRRIADETLTAHRIGPRLIRIERDSVLELLGRPIGAT
jgi:excisionase family DNA binding protein